jgi:hypothetical protein
MTGRFDPEEGKPYGHCTRCESKPEFATQKDAHDHLAAGEGHSVRITNPDRTHRIQSAVDDIVEDAIQSALEKVDEDIIRRYGATEEEVTEALKWHSDFADDWEEHWVGKR